MDHLSPAPRCCTWNITLDEFKTLRGKMDAANPAATTLAGYLGGTASWRTDLYTGRGTLLTVRESIRLNQKLGVGHTPELKSGDPNQIQAVFGGQAPYAQKLIDVLRDDAWIRAASGSSRSTSTTSCTGSSTRRSSGAGRYTWTTSTRPISRRSPS